MRSQIEHYKLNIGKTNALFSAIGAFTQEGELEFINEKPRPYLKKQLEGLSELVKFNYLEVPKDWLSPNPRTTKPGLANRNMRGITLPASR